MVTRKRAFGLLCTTLLAAAYVAAAEQSSKSTPRAATQANDAPPASAGHSLVYSTAHQMVLLVNAGLGGMTKPAASTPTRVWGWTGNEWRLLDASGPPVRNLGGVAYDSRRQTLVLHGGSYDFGASYGDTWEWSRAGWRRFAGPGPGVRDHTQMAYDAARGNCVLFGGSGDDPNVAFGDTWEFDGVRWQRFDVPGPPARIHHAMQYDPNARAVVVFGGNRPGVRDLGDTWSWNGAAWTSMPPPMPPRSHARMAFHRQLNALVVAGGMSRSGLGLLVRDDGWRPLAMSPDPGARYLTDMAYDARRKVLVLFGGGDPSGSALFSDTWEFNGTAWSRIKER